MPSLATSISGSDYLRAIWTKFSFYAFRPAAVKTFNMWWGKLCPLLKKMQKPSAEWVLYIYIYVANSKMEQETKIVLWALLWERRNIIWKTLIKFGKIISANRFISPSSPVAEIIKTDWLKSVLYRQYTVSKHTIRGSHLDYLQIWHFLRAIKLFLREGGIDCVNQRRSNWMS